MARAPAAQPQDRLFYVVWLAMHIAQLGARFVPAKTRPLFIGAVSGRGHSGLG